MRPWELVKTAVVVCVLCFLAMPSHADELKPGDHELTLTVGQRERTYLLHLLPVYDGKRTLPLVIVLHGG
jgi:poly(3-hydroxybutyrate) depolymerase